MSSVLHPVGPEPRERYWVRRLAVLIAAVVAIGIVIALVGNAMSAGSAVQAEPAPPTIAPPTLPVTPSASPTPSGTASPSASSTPGAAASSTATTPPSGSASPTDGSVVTPDPKQKPKTQRSTPPTDTEKKKAAVEAALKNAAAKKAAAQKKKKAQAPVLASCPSGDLRPTLTGPKKVKATKSATFAVSLINGSSKSCYLKVTSANYTLTVVSGKDKIWSSEDCKAAVPAQSRRLASQKSLDWKITWNGQRSGSGCSKQRETPRAGYYWAIANFDDAREVRWRIILT